MNQDRFDDLARTLASTTSRRTVLKTLAGSAAGGLLALLGVGEVAADDTCKPAGKKCNKHAQCCSGNCVNDTCAACPSGSKLCNGRCIPQSHCCGGGDCAYGQTCENGVCLTPLFRGLCVCNDSSTHTLSCKDDLGCSSDSSACRDICDSNRAGMATYECVPC